MLQQVGDFLGAQIEPITRAWVADLRRTPETEVHNNLFTRQIVDGLKATLAALAETIRRGQAPDPEGAALIAHLRSNSAAGAYVAPTQPDPLEQVRRLARHQGEVRQQQGYQIHEVIHEYITLRRIIMQRLGEGLPVESQTLGLAAYLNRLLDEQLLQAVQTYHSHATEDLRLRATRDPLTGLYNAQYFRSRLQEEVRRAARQAACVSLLVLDVDLLKQINDTYGHSGGDLLLQSVAEVLRQSARAGDLPCRIGGDEFAVILPATNALQAQALMERLLAALTAPITFHLRLPTARPDDNQPITLQPAVSIGLATYPTVARSAEALLAQADAAMYAAKSRSRTGHPMSQES